MFHQQGKVKGRDPTYEYQKNIKTIPPTINHLDIVYVRLVQISAPNASISAHLLVRRVLWILVFVVKCITACTSFELEVNTQSEHEAYMVYVFASHQAQTMFSVFFCPNNRSGFRLRQLCLPFGRGTTCAVRTCRSKVREPNAQQLCCFSTLQPWARGG